MLIRRDSKAAARQKVMQTLAPTLEERMAVARTVMKALQAGIFEMAARGRWRSAWQMAKKKKEATREQEHYDAVNDRGIITKRVRR